MRRRSARVRDAVNTAKIATLPIGSMVVQIVAKSLLILMSKGDMVNRERLTPEVERERGKVTTDGSNLESRKAEKRAIVAQTARTKNTHALCCPQGDDYSARYVLPIYRSPQRSKSRIHFILR